MGAPDAEQFIGGEDELGGWQTTSVVTVAVDLVEMTLFHVDVFDFPILILAISTHHLYDSQTLKNDPQCKQY